MKRLSLLLFAVVLTVGAANAQQQTPTAFTLDDCIRFAMENTIEVKNAHVDEQIAKAKVRETTGIGLPQVDGSIAVQHSNKLPRFFAQYAVAKGFNPDIDLGLPDDAVVASPNFFQLPSSGNAGVTVNQLLFSTTYLVGLKAADTYKQLATRSAEQTEIKVIENVTKAYYAVLINNERIGLFDNNIARVDSLLRTTTALNTNGFAEAIDVDRIRVTLNNLKAERLKFLNLQSLSIGLLKFQMNYPIEKEIVIKGSLSDLSVNENLFTEYETGWDYKNRIEYKMLETQRQLRELDVKNYLSRSHPSLVGFWNAGYSTQSPDIAGVFKTNTDISDNGFVGPDKWYPFSTFGVSLKVPIFSGLQRNYQTQQARLELLKVENQFTSLRQSIDLSIQQNTVTYKNAIETFRSQRENMELADRVAKITKIKYEQGVGSNIEVIDAENSLRQAQVNYYNSLFDAISAKTDLDVAYAKIEPAKYETQTTK
ncbi:TolC family protein [Chryseolinea sp. T2]|uniref:TolC family protein n=1 Tax=Chryseolinea sp. T2 TaxID=3129255 RepID=UPI0030779792